MTVKTEKNWVETDSCFSADESNGRISVHHCVPRLLHASELLQPDVPRWLQSEGGHAASDGLWGGAGSTRQRRDSQGQGGCVRADREPGQAQDSARRKRKQQKPTALRHRLDYYFALFNEWLSDWPTEIVSLSSLLQNLGTSFCTVVPLSHQVKLRGSLMALIHPALCHVETQGPNREDRWHLQDT